MTFLIFDCDGVLVDSEAIALEVLAQAITELGHPTDAAECRTLFMGKSLKDVLIGIETLTGRPLPEDWGTAANTQLFARFAQELQPVAGIAAAIAAMPYPRCVASSSQFDRIRLSLAVTGLAPLFGENVFSATQVAHGKPAPDLFLYAAATCGFVPTETIVIEDSPSGVTAALRAGMTPIGFAGASFCLSQPSRSSMPITAFSSRSDPRERRLPAFGSFPAARSSRANGRKRRSSASLRKNSASRSKSPVSRHSPLRATPIRSFTC
jgi:HAD superfamily hydrolase (TIGR01509 family)